MPKAAAFRASAGLGLRGSVSLVWLVNPVLQTLEAFKLEASLWSR
jgi:hypothetical protein